MHPTNPGSLGALFNSIGSSSWVGGPRNMKSMWLPLAAIFFMTCLYRAGGAMAPSASPDLLLLQTLVHWVHSSNPGSLGAPYKPWFIGCTLQTLVHWVHPAIPWFIGCTIQTLVHWVHPSNSGSLLIAKDFWLICRDDNAE